MFLLLSLITVALVFALNTLLEKRNKIASEGMEMSESIIKEVEKASQKEYKEYYSQFDVKNNHQKVLDRVDNVVVVNFVNQYQEMLKRNNIKVG